MSHGKNQKMINLVKDSLSRLEEFLDDEDDKFPIEGFQPVSPFFSHGTSYKMEDLYGFPHISRLFYLKGSALQSVYDLIGMDSFKKLKRWFEAVKSHQDINQSKIVPDLEILPQTANKNDLDLIRLPQCDVQSLSVVVPQSYFHVWVEELSQMKEGKKPPLRIPFVYTNRKGQSILAKM